MTTFSSIVAVSLGSSVLVDVPLIDAGIDSLAASELVQKLTGDFGVEIPAILLFDHPSISSITTCLTKQAPVPLE